jgi:rhodanese-related sulfurtransferase
MASHIAAREAAKLGYQKVFVMGAGISGWVKAGKPVEKGS